MKTARRAVRRTDLVAPPKRRVFEDIVSFITSQIETGRLRPGDRLKPERELSAELGVSRGSLREALKALEMLEVVELRHGHGVFVTLPQPQALSRIFGTLISMQPGQSDDIEAAREALEFHAVRLACRNAGPLHIARINSALGAMVDEAATGSGAKAAAADHDFHSAIVDASCNATLAFLYNAIDGLLQRGHQERWLILSDIDGFWDRLNEVHRRLVDAIAARDEQGAVLIMEEHFRMICDVRHAVPRQQQQQQQQQIPSPA